MVRFLSLLKESGIREQIEVALIAPPSLQAPDSHRKCDISVLSMRDVFPC